MPEGNQGRAHNLGAESIRAALRELAEGTTPRDFLAGLSAFLQEEDRSGGRRTVLDELARVVTLSSAGEGAQQQLHEVRSLLQAVESSLHVARELMDTVLRSLPAGPAVDVRVVADLRESFQDAWIGANRAMAVAANGLGSSWRPTHASVDLQSCVLRAVRLMTRGCSGEARIEVGTIPSVTVRPSSGELLQVLINLLRNALDAIGDKPEGRVVVTAWVTATTAFVRIQDNGPGIPAAERDRVLRLFYSTKPGGSGVGLFVCSRLIERWEGTLEIGSSSDSGAAFTIGIPLHD